MGSIIVLTRGTHRRPQHRSTPPSSLYSQTVARTSFVRRSSALDARGVPLPSLPLLSFPHPRLFVFSTRVSVVHVVEVCAHARGRRRRRAEGLRRDLGGADHVSKGVDHAGRRGEGVCAGGRRDAERLRGDDRQGGLEGGDGQRACAY